MNTKLPVYLPTTLMRKPSGKLIRINSRDLCHPDGSLNSKYRNWDRVSEKHQEAISISSENIENLKARSQNQEKPEPEEPISEEEDGTSKVEPSPEAPLPAPIDYKKILKSLPNKTAIAEYMYSQKGIEIDLSIYKNRPELEEKLLVMLNES